MPDESEAKLLTWGNAARALGIAGFVACVAFGNVVVSHIVTFDLGGHIVTGRQLALLIDALIGAVVIVAFLLPWAWPEMKTNWAERKRRKAETQDALRLGRMTQQWNQSQRKLWPGWAYENPHVFLVKALLTATEEMVHVQAEREAESLQTKEAVTARLSQTNADIKHLWQNQAKGKKNGDSELRTRSMALLPSWLIVKREALEERLNDFDPNHARRERVIAAEELYQQEADRENEERELAVAEEYYDIR